MSKIESKDASSFLMKTYSMVNDPASHRLISWNEMGNGFVVMNEVEFAQTLLPRFFRHKNMSSFVRQLNFYGFRKSKQDGGKCQFTHPNFLRNDPDALLHIKRKASEANTSFKEALDHLQDEVNDLKQQFNEVDQTQQQLLYVLHKYLRWAPQVSQAITESNDGRKKRFKFNTDNPTPWDMVQFLPNGPKVLNNEAVPRSISSRPFESGTSLHRSAPREIFEDLPQNLYSYNRSLHSHH